MCRLFNSENISGFILFISNENYYSFFLPQMTYECLKRYFGGKRKEPPRNKMYNRKWHFILFSSTKARFPLLKITIKLKIAFSIFWENLNLFNLEKNRLDINLFSNMEIIFCLKLIGWSLWSLFWLLWYFTYS